LLECGGDQHARQRGPLHRTDEAPAHVPVALDATSNKLELRHLLSKNEITATLNE
jgi:hypothetical protein